MLSEGRRAGEHRDAVRQRSGRASDSPISNGAGGPVMKAEIRRRALELGFDDCRFTRATPPDHAAEFQQWLGEKQHGEMAYLERNAHRRVNPQAVLPEAKSIITLAASYHVEDRGWRIEDG